MPDAHPSSERTRVRRKPDRGRYDRDAIAEILDEALICHVGFAVDGRPWVVPTAFARVGEDVYLHGAVGNFALRTLAGGAEACVSFTLLDGLVLARSASCSPNRNRISLTHHRLDEGRTRNHRSDHQAELIALRIRHHLERSLVVRFDPTLPGGPQRHTGRHCLFEVSDADVDVDAVLPSLGLGDLLKRHDKPTLGITDGRPGGVSDLSAPHRTWPPRTTPASTRRDSRRRSPRLDLRLETQGRCGRSRSDGNVTYRRCADNRQDAPEQTWMRHDPRITAVNVQARKIMQSWKVRRLGVAVPERRTAEPRR